MKITVVCVGKLKESFWREALEEYGKRLGRYCKFEIAEVADEPIPERASAAVEEQVKQKEAERILGRIREGACVCTLEINGQRLNSEQFAAWVEQISLSGNSQLVFVIGGSLGLHSSVLQRADHHLSFSDMTFPHQLMRVILAEQIYRAFRIIHHEPYHK